MYASLNSIFPEEKDRGYKDPFYSGYKGDNYIKWQHNLDISLRIENIFGSRSPKHIDLVQTTAYLESGARGELENINIEREAINLERKLVKNTLAYNNNLPESNQEKDFQNFDMDYFEHLR